MTNDQGPTIEDIFAQYGRTVFETAWRMRQLEQALLATQERVKLLEGTTTDKDT